jgi:Fuc2NAc and GlcNAc transferase
VWPILLAPFVLDASLTLALRLLRGSHPFRAHREHTYQRLLLSGVPLRRILHGLIVLQLALLWPAAFRAATDEGAALALAAGVLLMGGLAWLGLRRLVAPAAGAAPRG